MAQAGSRRICTNCGTMNSSQNQFCSSCGYALLDNTVNIGPPPRYASYVSHRTTGEVQPGALLEKRYRIIALIGKGGFGSVYEAQDERFQSRRVAIKEMSDAQLSAQEKAQALDNFRSEANLLVALDHPNLPDVSDFFEESGKAYLVMEFVQGQTLEKVLEDAAAPLDETRVLRWAIQLCDVLTYLHTQPQPIIFRDMKPTNVMVMRNEQIKLIDFGIARIFKSLAVKDTTSLGSRGFAPLEQYGSGQTDARTDIYALGATLYNLLTNTVPADAVTRRIHPHALIPPRQINPRLSLATERILLKALSEEPKDRFQTAEQMRQAILSGSASSQQFQHVAPPIPQPASPPAGSAGGEAGFRLSRRTVLTGLGVAAAAAVVGAGALAAPALISSTIPLTFIYSTEKDGWLQAALAAFRKSSASRLGGKTIQVQFSTSGSLDLTQHILSGTIKPVAWSPASSLEIDHLNEAWQKQHGNDLVPTTATASPPLVLSPLVFAIWDSRAQVLLNKYDTITWNNLYQALTLQNGWSDIGGPASWQRVSLGQTRPDLSNSGLLTIILMAYTYYQKTRGLTVNNVNSADFLNYLSTFEGAVTIFGRSSGTYLQNEVLLKGPGAYDVILTYENLVLSSHNEIKQRGTEPLRIFYPDVTIVSDHPFTILQGSWVTPEEQAAASALRQFLLDVPQQQLALQFGFRPTNQNVFISKNVPGNLFALPDVHNDIHSDFTSVQLPENTVVDALLSQWESRYKNVPTGNG